MFEMQSIEPVCTSQYSVMWKDHFLSSTKYPRTVCVCMCELFCKLIEWIFFVSEYFVCKNSDFFIISCSPIFQLYYYSNFSHLQKSTR